MRTHQAAHDNPQGIVQRLARGESVQAMLRRGEIAGQALALAQRMAAQAQAQAPAGTDRARVGGS